MFIAEQSSHTYGRKPDDAAGIFARRRGMFAAAFRSPGLTFIP
ncbi:hypothetical protein RSSM_06863 [Rhodopirellula sallentina SM41]|uniref:Uncharacterized protein n=1 Tax=Rhodopirellula sallentina SM41 TaxID=1263870 RepID=M5U1K4_9BACT|nr:hypothetical protein RSSM_06863 [Rhodopirellula sallentina SM41]